MALENVNNGFRQAGSTAENTPFFDQKDVPVRASFSIAPGATDVAEVTVTFDGGNGVAAAGAYNFNLTLSDNADGTGLTATTASGGIAPKAASGEQLQEIEAAKALLVQSLADGTFVLDITDSANTGFYVAVQNPFTGRLDVSEQLQASDYGV